MKYWSELIFKGFLSVIKVVFTGLLLTFLMTSCTREERPEGILSRQDMVRVLTELYLTEEKVQRLGIRPDSSVKVFEKMNPMIFEKTQISDSSFHRSMQYYMERPKDLEAIYSVLVDSLNLMEQRTPFATEEK